MQPALCTPGGLAAPPAPGGSWAPAPVKQETGRGGLRVRLPGHCLRPPSGKSALGGGGRDPEGGGPARTGSSEGPLPWWTLEVKWLQQQPQGLGR